MSAEASWTPEGSGDGWEDSAQEVVRCYTLLMEGRVGSSWLTEALATHPEVAAFPERFVTLKPAGVESQLRWASLLFSGHLSSAPVQGFKTKYRDVLDPVGFSQLLRLYRVKLLHLWRIDIVKVVLSEFNARRYRDATGEYNLYSGNRLPPMTVDLDEFDRSLRRRQQRDAALARFVQSVGQPVLSICYEDLLADKSKVVDCVLEFLGLEPTSLEGKAQKGTPDDLSQAVTNWRELCDHLNLHYPSLVSSGRYQG